VAGFRLKLPGRSSRGSSNVQPVTTALARIVEAWSGALGAPVISELAPGSVWELAAATGDRYVIKKLKAFDAPDPARRFTDEARILTYLLQRGVPVAVPVLSDDGRVCVTDEAGVAHAVFLMLPRREADDPASNPKLWQNVGAAVARMHVALAACPFGIDSWTVGPDTLPPIWRTVEQRLPADVVARLDALVRPRWDRMLEALSAPPQRIHGDVHGGNLLTVGHEVTGIIDCDHLPMGPRTYDLGYFLAFGVQWWLDRDQPSRPVDETIAVLRGYDTVSPLTPQERCDLPALALEVTLGLVDFFVREHDLVPDNWLGAAFRIGKQFDALERRLTAPEASFAACRPPRP